MSSHWYGVRANCFDGMGTASRLCLNRVPRLQDHSLSRPGSGVQPESVAGFVPIPFGQHGQNSCHRHLHSHSGYCADHLSRSRVRRVAKAKSVESGEQSGTSNRSFRR